MSTQTNLYFGTNGIWKYTVSRIMYIYGRKGTMTQTFLRVVFVRFRKSEPKEAKILQATNLFFYPFNSWSSLDEQYN
jgi:amino acid transporter